MHHLYRSRECNLHALGPHCPTEIHWLAPNALQTLQQSVVEDDSIFALAFNADGSRLAWSSANSTIHVHQWSNLQNELSVRGHAEVVTCLQWLNRTQRIVSGSIDKTIRLWDGQTNLHVFSEHNDWIRCIAASPDETSLISGCVSSNIAAWDLEAQRMIFKISANGGSGQDEDATPLSNTVNSLVYIDESGRNFASGSRDGFVKLWDMYSNGVYLFLSF